MEFQEHLIVISLGPVQDFIAQARKTRDLWFGSHLLSELSRVAAEHFQKEGELVFPALPAHAESELDANKENKLPVANKIIGLTRSSDPGSLVKRVWEAVQEHWKRYTQSAQRLLEQANVINPAMWKRQVKDFIEFHAAWSELPNRRGYKEALERVNQLLAGRKTLRDFRPNDPSRIYGELKSSLNPGRESVLLERHYTDYSCFGIKRKETLDAISLVKRLGTWIEQEVNPADQPYHFKSVCDLAFRPYRIRIKGDEEMNRRAALFYQHMIELCSFDLKLPREIKAARDIDTFDSRLFYEQQMEDLVEEYWDQRRKMSQSEEDGKKDLVKRLCASIRQFHAELAVRPSPYYAFLLCDGDRVGDRLKRLGDLKLHQQWSKRLSQFAANSRKIIQSHGGEFIYGGGDDCMALLPLDNCLQAVNDLRCHFSAIVQDNPDNDIAQPEDSPTLSAGLVVAHMLEPLGEVRRMAERAERRAKVYRNRLVVHVQKRSGGDQLQVSMSWAENPVKWLDELRRLYEKNVISVQLAHDLRQLHRRYESVKFPLAFIEAEKRELIVKEIERLLRKKKLDQFLIEDENPETLSQRMASLIRKGTGSALERLHTLAEQVMLAITLKKTEVGP